MSHLRWVVILLFCSALPLLLDEAILRHNESRSETSVPDLCGGGSTLGFGLCGRVRGTALSVKVTGRSLTRLSLDDSSLHQSVLDSSDLTGVRLNNSFVSLVGARDSVWTSCRWNGVGVFQSDFERARFESCEWSGGVFTESLLRRADFHAARVRSVRFVLSDLRGADLRGADFSESSFYLTNLQRARFDEGTKLPFSRQTALQRGMIEDDSASR